MMWIKTIGLFSLVIGVASAGQAERSASLNTLKAAGLSAAEALKLGGAALEDVKGIQALAEVCKADLDMCQKDLKGTYEQLKMNGAPAAPTAPAPAAPTAPAAVAPAAPAAPEASPAVSEVAPPPPPAASASTSPVEPVTPAVSEVAPPPPPPPPLPESGKTPAAPAASGLMEQIQKGTALKPVEPQPEQAPKPAEGRDVLLEQIQKGVELKKVEPTEPGQKPESLTPEQQVGKSMEAELEKRRQQIEALNPEPAPEEEATDDSEWQ